MFGIVNLTDSRSKRKVFLIVLLLNLFGVSKTNSEDFRFDIITTQDGLSQSSVFCILQDKKGFLWLGTEDGLNKYDGYGFTVYRHDPSDSTTISNNYITSLFQDAQGFIWIGTFGGLNKFDPRTEKFVNFRHDPWNSNSLSHDRVWTLCQDKNGNIWIGTIMGGLNKFNPETGQFTHYRHNAKDKNSINDDRIWAIYSDDDNQLWVGTSKGLNRFYPVNEKVTHFEIFVSDDDNVVNAVKTIYKDSAGDLWFGTWGGLLLKFDHNSKSFTPYNALQSALARKQGQQNLTINAIFEYKPGELLIATENYGLFKFIEKSYRITRYKLDLLNPNSLSNNHVSSIYKDSSDVMWVGTRGGLNKVNPSKTKFNHYKAIPHNPNSLNDNVVFAITEDRSGKIWIGTEKGLDEFDQTKSRFLHYLHDDSPQSLSSNFVRSILEDDHGFLWIGTRYGGLNKFDPTTNTFTHYNKELRKPDSIGSAAVHAIVQGQNGILWIGTNGSGLVKFDMKHSTFTSYANDPQNKNSLSRNNIMTLFEDTEGTLWIGTWEGGLNKFNSETNQFVRFEYSHTAPFGISDNTIFSVYEDDRGILWLGTARGLNRFDKQKESFTHFLMKDGLPNEVIYGILPDDNGNLWLSTNKGISKFNPQNMTFKNYDVHDGLQSDEFNFGAFCRSRNGELYFGGLNGFNVFHPDSLRDNKHIPPIVLTKFTKDNEYPKLDTHISFIKEIELSYQDNVLSFDFAALDFTIPEKNQYAYMLEGFDEDWIFCSNKRNATYMNLNPGRYIFRAKGSNNDGLWNNDGTSVRIFIKPPFWRTIWFYLLSGILVSLCIWGIHQLILKSKVRNSLKIERAKISEREKIKSEISKDFHDEIGYFITNIVIKCRTMLTKKKPIRLLDIKRILEQTMQINDSARDLIWTLDPEEDTIFNVCVKLKSVGEELLAKSNIDFVINDIPEKLKEKTVNSESKRQINLLYKECINNIVRHAQSSRVIVRFSSTSNKFNILIRDNGIGFDKELVDSGRGLKNIASRAKNLNANFKIKSKVGAGTLTYFSFNLSQIAQK